METQDNEILKNTLLKKENENNVEVKKNNGILQILKAMEPQIKSALPQNIDPERFTRIAMSAFSSNPKLQYANPISFISALMQSAQLGLEPNTPLGQAYLIPYKNKKGEYEVQFQLGYKGLLNLAHRTGAYRFIYSQAVYENDDFEIEYGIEPKLIHKPYMGDRGDIIGYYGAYSLVNGGKGFEYLTKDQVKKHALRFSKAYSNSPWQTDFDEMAKKTVLKRVLKYAPLSVEVEKSLAIDESIIKNKDKNNLDNVKFDFIQLEEINNEKTEE